MGFLKKLFGSGKKEEEIDEEVIEEPIEYKEEVKDESTQVRNFKYLDDLIHSGAKDIVLDSDIFLGSGEESDYKEGIKLDVDNLVIEGNSHTIDAKGKARIFEVSGKNIIIKNIILENGFAEEGGAINNGYGELTITESTLTENTAMYGGAINNRGELTITESTLQGNTAKEGNGGAINNRYGELTITESTLTENTADFGGAINNRYGELTITESTLQGNTAHSDGGAIYLNNKTKKYESNNCTFKDNKPDDVFEEKE